MDDVTHDEVCPSEINYSDATEIYDDPGPFQTVTYKRNRLVGIPLLFTTVSPDQSFWRVNPDVIPTDIMKATQENIPSAHITKDGNVVVNVFSEAAAQSLLGVKN